MNSEKAVTLNSFFSTIGNAKSFESSKVDIHPTFHRITTLIGDIVLGDKAFKDKFKLINTNK